MLRSRRDFARIQASGRTRADRLMTVRYVPNQLGYDRFGISTGRRLGGAVQRNRVRRRLRELLRQSTQPTGVFHTKGTSADITTVPSSTL